MAGISVSAGGWSRGRKARTGGQRRQDVTITPRATRLLVVGSVTVALAAATGILPGDGWLASTAEGQPQVESVARKVVSVRAGDSLWSIAARTMPGGDMPRNIERLKSVNGIKNSELQPGQRLFVPRANE